MQVARGSAPEMHSVHDPDQGPPVEGFVLVRSVDEDLMKACEIADVDGAADERKEGEKEMLAVGRGSVSLAPIVELAGRLERLHSLPDDIAPIRTPDESPEPDALLPSAMLDHQNNEVGKRGQNSAARTRRKTVSAT